MSGQLTLKKLRRGKPPLLGFWSLDMKSRLLTCCPRTACILQVPEHPLGIGPVLMRVDSADRRRLLRMALRSMQSAVNFDTIVHANTHTGTKRLRLIGGRGYQSDPRRPELHGIVEESFP